MNLSRFYIAVLFLCSLLANSQSIVILDLTSKNSESTKGNLFSIEHLLKTAGYTYIITDSVNLAIQSKIIFSSSNIETITFNTAEKDSLKSFVKNGGVWVATNNKESSLNSVFGISSTLFNYSRFYLNFKTNKDPFLFKYFDEPAEKQIRFGDTADYATTIGTRAFAVTTADTLATYETNEVAATHNNYFSGHTYMLGTQYKEIILRAQVKQDYGAARYYSNNFEPGGDVYMMLIDRIIKKHFTYCVNKYTAPCGFKSSLIITHDVDATTSMNYFDDFANYEKINNIKSTYLITTHYVDDKLADNFYDGNEDKIMKVIQMGHNIENHSVSHVPDFDNELIVPMGLPGNTKQSYQPYYNGTVSSNVNVFGEAEVSRDLLESVTHKDINIFRPGYLAFHEKLINVLDSLNYPFSSSHSANDVMTCFPFYSHTDLSMNGRLTNVLEIPNTISDVFTANTMSEENYLEKVEIWKNVFNKHYNNNSNCILLVHPTRYFKAVAQQGLVQSLPNDVVITTLLDFGNYWLNRYKVNINTSIIGDTLMLYLSETKQNINPWLSFVVNNGKDFSKIKIITADNQLLNYYSSSYENNSVLLFASCERPNYSVYSITETPQISNVKIYPNPSDKSNAWLYFEVMKESEADAGIYNVLGQKVFNLFNNQKFFLGTYSIHLPSYELSEGIYYVKLKIDEKEFKLKWILNKGN